MASTVGHAALLLSKDLVPPQAPSNPNCAMIQSLSREGLADAGHPVPMVSITDRKYHSLLKLASGRLEKQDHK